MCWSLRFTTIWVTILVLFAVTTNFKNSVSADDAVIWSQITASTMATCKYQTMTGMWQNEPRWQSGNTLETLCNFVGLTNSPLGSLIHQTYMNTNTFVAGACFDEYLSWLLAWVQAYSVQQDMNYLYRAADIYDYVAVNAWNDSICRGGLQLCWNNTYKSAAVNELFLLSSMRLHPYAAILDRPATFYLDHAQKQWLWFETSGLINGNSLVNEGLSDGTCANNNGTTWTSNQGIILPALVLLYNATGNVTLLNIAQKIADTATQQLTYSDGILKEPCEPNCTVDQQIYKGIFIRELAYIIPYLTDAAHIQQYKAFIQKNAVSVWTSKQCEADGLYGVVWTNQSNSSCDPLRNTSSTSAVWDLFVSTVKTQPSVIVTLSNWTWVGLGDCEDDRNNSMPNFNKMNITESVCRATAEQDPGSLAYDHQLGCNGFQYCRIRTLSDPKSGPQGWSFENGTARNVTRSNNSPVTSCYLKVT